MSRRAWLGCALIPVVCASGVALAQVVANDAEDPDVADLIELLNTPVISAS